MELNGILEECRSALQSHYGSLFGGLILYGSLARAENDPGSDIDLLVLINGPFNHFRELRVIVELLYPIQLESERLISAKPAPVDDFERGAVQLYRNAKREGTRV